MSNELWLGLAAAVGASILFGTVFVPVKKVVPGDGETLYFCIFPKSVAIVLPSFEEVT
ncbi:unnamed protein product [Strongylus vulgaris]|uniref:Uncharacterized protein n=1 Tax=Strongylus vulgaris TaxID=40348 RepID=A0A3P7IM13_STRVU|nr:unnamed protein product [Strongylus vulgaris]